MSNTVDERVVKMQFDNSSFEKNVRTSLGTLSKLKDALHFDKIDMSGVVSNIEKITDKVTSMGGVWDVALDRISNKIVDVGQQLASSFIFKPPSDGFNEYELKMDSLKVIMESSHESLETVNEYLNELNKYSDKTIYSFSDMTASIGKFTNAGVDLETSVNAIKGIANEAALAGASTSDASRAMYNFAQALSAGSVKLIDWKSIENANMATQDFKNELIKTAVELGTIRKEGDKYVSTTTNMQGKVSEAFDATQGFNDSLAHQWMTTDVLTKTLGRYADANTDIGARATKAATEVRTFSAMMDALKESVGSGWATTWELIFGNMEEATEMWTAINDVLSGFIDKFSDARNNLLQGWKDLGGRTKLLEGLANVFHILGNVVKPFSDAMKVLFPPITSERLADLTNKFADFTKKIRDVTENFPMKLFGKSELLQTEGVVTQIKKLSDVTGITNSGIAKASTTTLGELKKIKEEAGDTTTDLEKLQDVVKKVINGDFGNGQSRADALKKAGFDPEQVQNYVDKIHELSNGSWDLSDEMMKAAAESLGLTEVVAEASEDATNSAKDSLSEYETEVGKVISNGNVLTKILITVGQMVKNVFGSGLKILGTIKDAWSEAFSPIKITLGDVVKFQMSLERLSRSLMISDEVLERVKYTAKNFFTAFKTVADLVVKYVMKSLPSVIKIVQSIASTIGDVVLRISSFVSATASAIARSWVLSDILNAISSVINKLAHGFSVVAEVVKYFGDKLSAAGKYISNYFKVLKIGIQASTALNKTFGDTANKFEEFKKKLSERFGFKNLDEFKAKMDALLDKLAQNFFIPSLQKFAEFIMDLLNGKFSIGKLTESVANLGKGIGSFFKNLIFPEKKTGIGVLADEADRLVKHASTLQKVTGFFDKLGPKASGLFRSLAFPEKKTGIGVLADEADRLVKKASLIQSVNKFAFNLGKNIRTAFENIDFNAISQTVTGKIKNVFNTISGVIKSFIDGIMLKGIPRKLKMTEPNGFLDGIVKFFDKSKGSVDGMTRFSEAFKNSINTIKAPFEKDNASKAMGQFVSNLQDANHKVPQTLGEKLKAVAKGISDFIANIDYKKLLTAARAVKVVTSIFNGMKLTKSFSGMADNIGGFFESLKDGINFNLVPEESKFTKIVKVAAAIFLVAKSMAMIAEIPKDRLKSSVGVVAGIAGVMTAIVILLEKMKPAEGADLGAAAKTMLALSAAIYIIAKAMALIGEMDPESLIAGGIVVGATVLVLTKATKSLKDLKLNTADALAPIGFAIALGMLVKTVKKFGEMDTGVLIKGGVAVYIALSLLESAVDSLRGLNVNAATVFAPLAFVIALGILLTEVIAFSLIPPGLMVSGLIRVGIMLGLLEGVMTSLKGMNLSAATVAAPLAFAGAILLLMVAVVALGLYPLDKFTQGLVCVIALGAVIAGMYALIEFINGKLGANDISAVVYMIPLVLAIALLGATAVVLGIIPRGVLIKGFITVTALAGLIVGIIALLALISEKFNGSIDKSIIIGLVAVVISLVSLAAVTVLLGMFPPGVLAKGVITLIGLGLVLSAMEYVLVKASKEMNISASNIAAMIVTVIALQMLAAAAMVLGLMPPEKLLAGVLTLAALGAILAGIEYALGRTPRIGASDILAMIVIVLAIQALALTVVLVGLVPTEKLVKGTVVVGLLSGFIAGLGYIFGSMTFGVADIIALITIVGSVMALVAAVMLLGSMDTGDLIKGTGGILALLAGLTIALTALCGLAGPLLVLAASFAVFGAGALMIGAGFLLIATGVMTLVAAMEMLSKIDMMSLLKGIAVFTPVLAVVVGAFIGLAAAATVLGVAVVPILALAAAFALFGAGLYLIVAAIAKFVEVSGDIIDAFKKLGKYIAEHLSEFADNIHDALVKGLNFIKEHIGPFIAKAGELIGGVIKTIAEKAPEIAAKIGDGLGKAIKWIANHIPEWLKAGGELIVNLIKGIGEKIPDVIDKAKELIGKAKDGLLEKVGEWIEAGKQMIGGLIEGIGKKAGELVEKAKGVVGNAIDAARNLLRINSPSKVFRDMGYSIDEGFIVGMERMAGKVSAASEFVATGIVDAAKKPLDSLADLMSGDMITDPTITPVLDLSEIQNGTDRLYAMLPESEQLSFSGNVRLANDASLSITRDRRQKEANDNEMMNSLINAINGLSALIGTTGNVYNVNGVTYDDGSNVSSAVRSLIHAAKIGGRM